MDPNEKTMQNMLQEIRRGSIAIAVLIKARKPYYGYSLVTDLKKAGVDIEQNTLYPLLRRLESQGLMESSWDTTESRPRKFYRITAEGSAALETLIAEWRRLNGSLENMITMEETP